MTVIIKSTENANIVTGFVVERMAILAIRAITNLPLSIILWTTVIIACQNVSDILLCDIYSCDDYYVIYIHVLVSFWGKNILS